MLFKKDYIWWIVFNKNIWNLNRFLTCPSLYKNNTTSEGGFCNRSKMRGTNFKKRDEIYQYIMNHVVKIYFLLSYYSVVQSLHCYLYVFFKYFLRNLCVLKITAISIVVKITTCVCVNRWRSDWFAFFAVSAVFQPFDGGLKIRVFIKFTFGPLMPTASVSVARRCSIDSF